MTLVFLKWTANIEKERQLAMPWITKTAII